jgi:hypothetical protein
MKLKQLFLSVLAIALTLITTGLFAQEDEGIIPGPPTHVKVSVVGDAIQIQWDAPEENAQAVTGYEIARAHTPNGLFRRIVHVPRNVFSYRDDTIRQSLKYFYKVRAESEDSFSEYSSPVSAEIAEPQNQK